MKVIKWVLIVLATLVFLIGTAVFVLITYYKKEMTNLLMDELKTQYGLHLEVEKATVSLCEEICVLCARHLPMFRAVLTVRLAAEGHRIVEILHDGLSLMAII